MSFRRASIHKNFVSSKSPMHMIFFKPTTALFLFLSFLIQFTFSSFVSFESLERASSSFIFDVSNPMIPVRNFAYESKESWKEWLQRAMAEGRDLSTLLNGGHGLIHIAVLSNAAGLLHALVELNVDINLKTSYGHTAYNIACETASPLSLKLADHLKDKGCNTSSMEVYEKVDGSESESDADADADADADSLSFDQTKSDFEEPDLDLKILFEMIEGPIYSDPYKNDQVHLIEGVRYFEF